MTVADALRVRRHARARQQAAATAGAMRVAADDFRRRAAQCDTAEAAQAYLDEAELFEAAARRHPAL